LTRCACSIGRVHGHAAGRIHPDMDTIDSLRRDKAGTSADLHTADPI
jgi:hypothetical protein